MIKGQPVQYLRGHCSRRTIAQQLEERVTKGHDCWEWQGSYRNGYGRINWNWETVSAHRAAWELANGRSVPEGLCVMHRCDNKRCVRPDHLTIGTPDDNMQDKMAKGRFPHNETHPRARFSREDVQRMRALHDQGMGFADIADRYGSNATTVRDICLHLTRKYV